MRPWHVYSPFVVFVFLWGIYAIYRMTWLRSAEGGIMPHRRPEIMHRDYYVSATFDIPGLGNLMFQYASILGIGLNNRHVPIMPGANHSLSRIFKLPMKRATPDSSPRPGEFWPQINEIKASSYDPFIGEFHFNHDVEVVGYLQSYKYFEHCINDVRRHFTFQDAISKIADGIFSDISHNFAKHEKPLLYIGIHVRRGDFLNPDKQDFGYTVADKVYIQHAMNYMENLFQDNKIAYIVCGSDIAWNKANVTSTTSYVYYSEGYSEEVDLALLANCSHVIMTVGTFGWWAGFLAGGQVMYYRHFPRNGSLLSSRAFSPDRSDYYPKSWIGLV